MEKELRSLSRKEQGLAVQNVMKGCMAVALGAGSVSIPPPLAVVLLKACYLFFLSSFESTQKLDMELVDQAAKELSEALQKDFASFSFQKAGGKPEDELPPAS